MLPKWIKINLVYLFNDTEILYRFGAIMQISIRYFTIFYVNGNISATTTVQNIFQFESKLVETTEKEIAEIKKQRTTQ